jgi:hypothetical protein
VSVVCGETSGSHGGVYEDDRIHDNTGQDRNLVGPINERGQRIR